MERSFQSLRHLKSDPAKLLNCNQISLAHVSKARPNVLRPDGFKLDARGLHLFLAVEQLGFSHNGKISVRLPMVLESAGTWQVEACEVAVTIRGRTEISCLLFFI
jgi:hypothetical protein